MGVIIGSARIDENGKLSGGKAGDQTEKEVSTQEFYIHKLGWLILRLKDPDFANRIAILMRYVCEKNIFGYDQGNRLDVVKKGIMGNDQPTEGDCSSYVRVCFKEATGKDPGNFTTYDEATALKKTGLVEEIEYRPGLVLYTGDILVTKKKGHTVVVVKGEDRIKETSNMAISKAEQTAFIARITPLVQRQAAAHDYHLYPSVTIAQAIHESGWGTAKKMVAANALFGVKVGSGKKYGSAWHGSAYKTGTTEYYDGKTATRITDYFRQYDSVEDSICDYMDLLVSLPRYRGALDCGSPEESIKAIVKGGYATGPEYANKIIHIINQYNLKQFDKKGIISSVCPYPFPGDYRTYKRGHKGDVVKTIQWCLNTLMDAKLTVDGCFGPATEEAVIVFQDKTGLVPDGKVGPKTWAKIKEKL